MPTERVYIGIGSNLGDSKARVKQALTQLNQIPKTRLCKQSSLYQTEAVSDIAQNDFINAMAELETSLEPQTLLLELQKIEQSQHRQRDPAKRWGPRTLDLDIILFGERHIDSADLVVPHIEFRNRLFVLDPLFEIAGDLVIDGVSLEAIIKQAPKMNVVKLEPQMKHA